MGIENPLRFVRKCPPKHTYIVRGKESPRIPKEELLGNPVLWKVANVAPLSSLIAEGG